jgi:uncharacterized damage-inducible protein DinB
MTTTETTTSVNDTAIASLKFSRSILTKLIEDVPEDKMTAQPYPGANHVLWIMGHLASADDAFLADLDGRERVLPAQWKDLFGMGSEPTDDPAKYPSPDEVRAAMEERREAVYEWIGGLTADRLAQPLPEPWTKFSPNHALFINTISDHEAFHVGQISAVRRALGMPSAFG